MAAIIEFTTGEPGSGKSYRRCAHFIVRELLNPKEPTQNGIISNYPVRFDPWVDKRGVEQPGLIQVAHDLYGLDEFEVRDRVKVFPPDEVESWIPVSGQQCRGPWDYLAEEGIEVAGWHIAIDEIHNFSPKGNGRVSEAWARWLGEIRHEGCTIEFLTQDPGEVSRSIVNRAGLRRQLVPSVNRRDPFFNILLDDWYQVGTVFGKEYRPSVWQVEQRKVMSRWTTTDEIPFWFNPELFGVYDSHSSSNSTGRSGAQADPAYKRFGKVGLSAWFLRRNGWRLVVNKMVPRAVAVTLFILVAFNLQTILAWVGATKPQSKTERLDQERPANVSDEALPEWERYEKAVAEFETKIDKVAELLDQVDGVDVLVGLERDRGFLGSGQVVRLLDPVVRADGTESFVKRINFDDRSILFADDSVVRVGGDFGVLSRVSAARDTADQLRAALSGGPGPGPGDQAKRIANRSTISDVIGGRSEPGGSSPAAGDELRR